MKKNSFQISGGESVRKEVPKNELKRKTHEEFRTKSGSEINYQDLYDFIKEEATNTGVSQETLFERLRVKLDLQHSDVVEIIRYLEKKFLQEDDSAREKNDEENRRRELVQAMVNYYNETENEQMAA